MTKPETIEREIEATQAGLSRKLDALEARFSPGQLLDEVLGGNADEVKVYAGEVLERVKGHPVPAAMAAAGLAWLAAAQVKRDDYYGVEISEKDRWSVKRGESLKSLETRTRRLTDESDEGYRRRLTLGKASVLGIDVEDGEDSTKFLERVETAAEQAKTEADGIMSRIQEAASQAASQAADAAGNLADQAGSAFADAKQAVSGAADSATSTAQGAAGSAANAFQRGLQSGAGAAQSAGQVAGQYSQTAERHFDALAGYLNDLPRNNPLILGALAFAGGALVGGMAPLTSKEEELLKEPASKLADMVGDAKDKATDVAGTVKAEAKDVVAEAKGAAAETAAIAKEGAAKAVDSFKEGVATS